MEVKKIMMEGTFKQMYFSFGSVEIVKLQNFCLRKCYKTDDIISLYCTAFNDNLDWEFARKNYPDAIDKCKIFRELGVDWRNNG